MSTEILQFVSPDGTTTRAYFGSKTTWNRVIFAPSGAGKSLYSAGADWAPGRFKHEWATKLAQSGSLCQLPRGFVKAKKPVFVGKR